MARFNKTRRARKATTYRRGGKAVGRGGIYRKGRTTGFYRKVQKALMARAETKYFTSSVNVNFAANATTGAGEGYASWNVPVPTASTGVSGRIGSKVIYSGFITNCRVEIMPKASNNTAITGRMMLVKYVNGGTTFNMTNFLQQSLITSSWSYTSLRNIEYYSDYQVLKSKRVVLASDNYTGGNSGYSFKFAWKGIVNQSIVPGGTTPADNSLYLVFIADSGDLVNNFINLKGDTCIYYKDF